MLPMAGMGTRMLPATKAVPKEILPLVDRPGVQLIVEECVASGIEEIVFVLSRGKASLMDHFDRNLELEALLEKKGKSNDLALVRDLATMARFSTVRQPEPLGLGHAVLCASAVVGNEPFAVLLPDDLIDGDIPGVRQLMDVYEARGEGVVALLNVPEGETDKYGMVRGQSVDTRVHKLDELVEKPATWTDDRRLAVVGRYVLPPEVFQILEHTPRGRGGEIQLTDALAVLARDRGLYGIEFEGERFDTGDRVGFVLAQVHYALKRPDLARDIRAGLARLLG